MSKGLSCFPGQPPPLPSKLEKSHVLWRELSQGHPSGRSSQLPRLNPEAGAPMKSHLHHEVMGTRPFPSPGLSFPRSALSRPALKLAMLMEISPFLNRTSICVFWDRPTGLAERWLGREGPGRRGGVMSLGAKKGRVKKPPPGTNAGLGGRAHRGAGETSRQGTQQSVFHPPVHFPRY